VSKLTSSGDDALVLSSGALMGPAYASQWSCVNRTNAL